MSEQIKQDLRIYDEYTREESVVAVASRSRNLAQSSLPASEKACVWWGDYADLQLIGW